MRFTGKKWSGENEAVIDFYDIWRLLKEPLFVVRSKHLTRRKHPRGTVAWTLTVSMAARGERYLEPRLSAKHSGRSLRVPRRIAVSERRPASAIFLLPAYSYVLRAVWGGRINWYFYVSPAVDRAGGLNAGWNWSNTLHVTLDNPEVHSHRGACDVRRRQELRFLNSENGWSVPGLLAFPLPVRIHSDKPNCAPNSSTCALAPWTCPQIPWAAKDAAKPFDIAAAPFHHTCPIQTRAHCLVIRVQVFPNN